MSSSPNAGPALFTLPEPSHADRSRVVPYDLPELRIGIAEYDEGPTGCTVLHFAQGAACATDIRGGAPGVIGGYSRTDAVCFAGGSLYGLEAVHGVASELLARRGTARWGQIAVVSGAIIYDFGPRETLVYPDKELGRRALLAAESGSCPVGQRGAGRLASVGKLYQAAHVRPEAGGQGAAFRMIGETGVGVFVLSVVNAVGVIVDRAGSVVRGCYDPARDLRHHPRDLLDPTRAETVPSASGTPTQNTTVTAVVTNKRLTPYALNQLGRQVHASMARAIQPFHTPRDGDVLFALSTETVPEAALDDFALAEIASDLAWDAVLNAVGQG
jgi:L-aminopeptidase/D-esterase-like protein